MAVVNSDLLGPPRPPRPVGVEDPNKTFGAPEVLRELPDPPRSHT